MSKEYFDRVAHQWDEMRAEFFSESVREKAFSVAKLQEGKIAADVGAGTGFITEGLIRKGLWVIAVDHSEAMLKEMIRKFTLYDKIDYCIGEAETLPFTDGAVDYVFANMCLHHVESPPKAIKEMARILRPEGKLIITDLDEHNFEFLRAVHHDRWMGFKREDIREWFRKAGLKKVVVDCVGETCCAQSYNEDVSFSIFVASGEK